MGMIKFICTILAICFVTFRGASAGFSVSSTQYDPELAQLALQIAETCGMPSRQESFLAQMDYHCVGFYNANRRKTENRHVATYAVYDRQTQENHTEVIIAIRGTGDGEWELNLDLMPSGNFDLPYAENFALAAEDILSTQRDYLDSLDSPVFLITGHSRGAAVANILGARLTDRFHAENVFVYTFATPGTVRGEYPDYSNIFNVINPADVIPYLPFPQWGFERYGVDIELPVEEPSLMEAAREAFGKRKDRTGAFTPTAGLTAMARKLVSTLAAMAPEIRDGYTIRHALTHPGAAGAEEEGMTAGEFLLMIFEGNLLAGISSPDSLPEFARTENDFTPFFRDIGALSVNGSYSWISEMHMPATYGAWMTVTGSRTIPEKPEVSVQREDKDEHHIPETDGE